MGEIVEGLHKKYVAKECLNCTGPNRGWIGEKHSWEDQLKSDLNPHVKDASYQVVILFSHQLFL
jgi:hypothetical protein